MGDKKKLADFKQFVTVANDQELKASFPEIAAVRREVEAFAASFPTIGYEESEMQLQDRFT